MLVLLDRDALSTILGWISIGCWILVYSPQIYENYRIESGEGLSLLFLLSWVVGDLCNAAGAVLGGLVSTVIILAIYFLACDLILMAQVYYYRWKRSRYPIRLGPMYDHVPSARVRALGEDDDDDDDDDDDELEPLLGNTKTTTDDEIRGRDGTLRQLLTKYALCLIFVTILGIGAWWFDLRQYDDDGGGDDGYRSIGRGGGWFWFGRIGWGDREWMRPWVVQGLGWSSAALYIFGHLPQLFKNRKTRCRGLAPELFIFSSFGNITYVLSVCAKSMKKEYLITNGSWLVGQGLTAVLDCLVIGQIIYYRYTRRGEELEGRRV